MQHRGHVAPSFEVHTLERVDRAEHLRQRPAHRVQVEFDVVGIAVELVHTGRQTVTVDLVTMLQSGLHDAVTARHLVDEASDVRV